MDSNNILLSDSTRGINKGKHDDAMIPNVKLINYHFAAPVQEIEAFIRTAFEGLVQNMMDKNDDLRQTLKYIMMWTKNSNIHVTDVINNQKGRSLRLRGGSLDKTIKVHVLKDNSNYETWTFTINENGKISDIKDQIFLEKKIPQNIFVLSYENEVLNDRQTLPIGNSRRGDIELFMNVKSSIQVTDQTLSICATIHAAFKDKIAELEDQNRKYKATIEEAKTYAEAAKRNADTLYKKCDDALR